MDTISKLRGVQKTAPSAKGRRFAESAKTQANASRIRRGPLRPDVLLNVRQRNSMRLRVFYYRGLDITLTAVLAVSWLAYPANISSVGGLTLIEVAPYLLGWACALWFVITANLYNFNRPKGPWLHSLVVGLMAALGLVTGLALQVIWQPTKLDEYLGWAGVNIAVLVGLHLIWAHAVMIGRLTGALTPNVVLVGATQCAEQMIVEALKRRDVNILGIFDDRKSRSPDSVCGVPILGPSSDLLNHRLAPYLDCIALTVPSEAADRVDQLKQQLSILPNRIVVLIQGPEPDQVEISRALDKLAYMPVHLLNRTVNDDRRAFYKRVQDLVLGTLGLIALLPFLLLIALLIRLDSPGPALFKQRRHGFNQEEIVVWKFRSMHHHLADRAGINQVQDGDERITRIGRILRMTSLDELPQLLNVLTGQMSLVGPRPHAIGMKTGQMTSADIVAEYAHRHRIKPGMTGWAAINGSRGPMHKASDVRRRVQLDIDYIERQSFWFDLIIMLRTLPVLLGDKVATR